MKRTNAIIILLLISSLIMQLIVWMRVGEVKDGINSLGLSNSRTFDLLNGKLYRIMEYLDIPPGIVVDNPDGTSEIK